MDSVFVKEVYDTLTGCMTIHGGVPGVENAFDIGCPCFEQYCKMLAAYERLCDRLGVVDEDQDVEIIIQALFDIEETLCMKMFHYGYLFGSSENGEK